MHAAEFPLRYSKRESWDKLNRIGEALVQKFLAEEAHKFAQVLAVEAEFQINDWGEHDVLLSDQLTAYRLAEPDVD
jgi:hypothetical protein